MLWGFPALWPAVPSSPCPCQQGLQHSVFGQICIMARTPNISGFLICLWFLDYSKHLHLQLPKPHGMAHPAVVHSCGASLGSSLDWDKGATNNLVQLNLDIETPFQSSSRVSSAFASIYLCCLFFTRKINNSPRIGVHGAPLPGNFKTWPCRKFSHSFKSFSGCYSSLNY